MGIGDLLFGKWCVGCSKMGSYLCENCMVGMVEAELVCPGCGRRSDMGKRHQGCESFLDGLVCVWEKEGIVKKMMFNIKKKLLFDQVKYLTESVDGVIQRDDYWEFRKIFKRGWGLVLELENNEYRKQGFDENKIFGKIVLKDKKVILQKSIFGMAKRKRWGVVIVRFDWGGGGEMQKWAKILKEKGFVRVWGFCVTR